MLSRAKTPSGQKSRLLPCELKERKSRLSRMGRKRRRRLSADERKPQAAFSRKTSVLVAVFAVLMLPALQATAAQPSTRAPSTAPAPTEADMKRAIDKVRLDPNLGSSRELRKLNWAGKDTPPPHNAGALAWLTQLARWLAETSRILIYVAAGLAAIALVLYITRFLGDREPRAAKRRVLAPTHVRELDIRPESLPNDIGAAALELWERNESRAALSLLYRGLLSRLAHAHAVPIRAATTEGDCLALAEKHLPADRAAYVSRLVKVWQQAVYGGKEPETQTVAELCEGFAPALDPNTAALQAQPA